MDRTHSVPDNTEVLNKDIAALRQEVAQLHGELRGAMRHLSAILSSLQDIRGFEARTSSVLAHLDAEAGAVQARVSDNTSRCHACGARVTRHPAEAGDLLLCPVCGWSAFVDRQGHEECEVRPTEPPAGRVGGAWTS